MKTQDWEAAKLLVPGEPYDDSLDATALKAMVNYLGDRCIEVKVDLTEPSISFFSVTKRIAAKVETDAAAKEAVKQAPITDAPPIATQVAPAPGFGRSVAGENPFPPLLMAMYRPLTHCSCV